MPTQEMSRLEKTIGILHFSKLSTTPNFPEVNLLKRSQLMQYSYSRITMNETVDGFSISFTSVSNLIPRYSKTTCKNITTLVKLLRISFREELDQKLSLEMLMYMVGF